jgi:hypothetical protein
MQLALRGLGLVDTGGGITPANWESKCCTSWFGLFDSYDHVGANDACEQFYEANSGLFAGQTPCSSTALSALKSALTVPVIPPPAPPIVTSPGPTYGQAMVPKFTCPAAVSPCPCDGRLVQTAQDGQDLLTCQALQQQALQNAAIAAAMGNQASSDCLDQAATCAASFLSAFVSPSTDCTGCVLDFTKPATLLAIAILVFVLVKAK